MVCDTQIPVHPIAYMQNLSIDAMQEKAAGQEAVALTELCEQSVDVDSVPQPLSLQRCTTLTEYNEVWHREWTYNGDNVHEALPCALYTHAPLADAPHTHFLGAPTLIMFKEVPLSPTTTASDLVDVISSASSTRDTSAEKAVLTVPAEQRSFTQAEKEVKKLEKKLYAISKLQERVDAGDKLDKLQMEKVQKRHEIETEIIAAQKVVEEEMAEMKALYAKEAERNETVGDTAHSTYDISFQAPAQFNIKECWEVAHAPFQDGVSKSTCSQLLSDLERPGPLRDVALSYIHNRVQTLTYDAAGCRVVQLALDVAAADIAADLAGELHGRVQDAIQSPHGNYVIQKIVERLPGSVAGFVAEEVRHSSCSVARHRFGCRVLSRLFENAASFPGPQAIADELMHDIVSLSRHTFAHHVIQTILAHGLASHKEQIAHALMQDMAANAQDRNSMYVVESAMIHCSREDQQALIISLLGQAMQNVQIYVRCLPGIHLLRAVIRLHFDQKNELLKKLFAMTPQIRKNSQGHRLLQDMQYAEQQAY